MSAILPRFTIDTAQFPKSLKTKLQDNLQQISSLLENDQHFTWDNLMRPLEDMDDELERFWTPLSHLRAVVDTPPLRKCFQECLPLLSSYEAAIGHNEALYRAIKSLDRTVLDKAQNKIIDDCLRDFELSGVALPAEDKKRFEAIQSRLSELSNQFENNILDAENSFQLHIKEASRLKGLPEHAMHTAEETAREKKMEGWVLTLQFPCYLAVMTYAQDRKLREEMYFAYVARASDEGPDAGRFDNSSVMNEILKLRHEKAKLLGFANYAELSLATKMAKSPHQVMEFLMDLSQRVYQQGQREFQHLEKFAAEHHGITSIQPWDVAYLSEKKRQRLYAFSQEDLRAYFPQEKVFAGMFAIVNKLYGIQFEEVDGVDIWHADVKCYRILDEHKTPRGYIYTDLYARSAKRGGAWMDALQSRRKLNDGSIQLPIATLTCNFAKASVNKPAMLSHEEVLTMFHEFGHCLHHVLTQVDYLNASGIHGVEWDAVEFPSQFFENWCWEEHALSFLTAHVETGKPLPKDLYDKLWATKNYQSAMAMLRQLEFSLFDFKIHLDFRPQDDFIMTTLAEVREQTCVTPLVSYNRFPHSFSHIFAGGYAAGYYSYKWAEVLSSDAYARFEEEGIFNGETGRDFLHFVLEAGGSAPAIEAFMAFRGREAELDAFLRHNGIQAEKN
ncbi:M3 family peptidase [Legionella israelensis]|uniref:oligopeptidase A n=1 Tax=Legionella israelensis TaxID=454 RepID=A0AAX1ECT0_9GAMM|nr:M3 family metallopeptidase [Legionella israelensis]QBR82910.1 M3 family peptidase [Legionella israelensis]